MKRRMLALLLTLCMVVSLLPTQLVIATGEEETTVTWAIEGLANEVTVGDTATATVKASEGEITDEVTWSSSNTDVATVNGSGTTATVNYLSAGTVTITAKGSSVEESVTVTVKAAETSTPTTATVTIILGNSKTFVLQKDNVAAAGPDTQLAVDVPVNSSLAAEGYSIVLSDENEQPLGWTVNGDANNSLATAAEVLAYTITGDTTFEAGWTGVGGDSSEGGGSGAETSGYYVKFDGYHSKGTFTVVTDDGQTDTTGYVQGENAEPGQKIGDFLSFEITKDPEWDVLTFGGWYKFLEWEAEGTTYSAFYGGDTTVYTTEEVMNMEMTGDNLVFVAKWNEIPMSYYNDYNGKDYAIPAEIAVGDSKVVQGDVSVRFTPSETGEYTIYSQNEDMWHSQVAYVWGSGNTNSLESNEWYRGNASFAVWSLEKDVTYELLLHGEGETYYLQKVVEPTAMAFESTSYEGYAGFGQELTLTYTPIYASASDDITYTVPDSTVINMEEGYAMYQNPGSTTVTATRGGLSATCTINVLDPVELTVGTENTSVMSMGHNLRYTFTVPADGNYAIKTTAAEGVDIWIQHDSYNREGWWTEEQDTYISALKAGTTYEIGARATAGLSVKLLISATTDPVTNPDFTITDGEEGGGEGEPSIHIDGNGGDFTVKTDNEEWTTNGYGIPAAAGESASDYVVSISDPVFWDSSRAFEGWKACTHENLTDEEGNTYEDDVQIEGTSIMTTAEMLAYPARTDGKQIIFIAQWAGEDDDYYNGIKIDALDGSFEFGNDNWGNFFNAFEDRFRLNGKTFGENMESWIVSDPTHDQYTFEGWLEYKWDEGELVSETVLTTAQITAKTVTDYNVMFVAKWDGISIDDYKTMFQQGGGDEGGNEGGEPNVEINANFGEVLLHGANETAGAHGINVEPGKSMTDVGEKVDDPVYWDNARMFTGWIVTTWEELTDEAGGTYWDDVQIPGTSLMTTAEMLAYATPVDGTKIKFVAQWAGDDSDYFSHVGFETLDGTLTMVHPDGGTEETTAPGQRCREDGTKISEQIEWTIPNAPVHPEYTFEGWLVFEDGIMNMVSETIYTTEQVFDMTVPSYDVRFMAKWSGISIEDYKTMFQSGSGDEGGEGTTGGSILPGDVTPTAIVLDRQYSLTADQDAFFTYTAAADGWYAVKTDLSYRDVQVNLYVPAEGSSNEDSLSSDYALVFYLLKDQVAELQAVTPEGCNLWMEKLNHVTKLEVASQDTTTEYPRNGEIMPFHTLKDVDLKVTYADGTTAVVDGEQIMQTSAINGMPIYMELFEVENNADVVGVRVYCCDGNVEYQINLTKATIVKFEATPGEMFDFYENLYGGYEENENGETFFFYEAEDIAFWLADYKLTWSDGTVETFNLDLEGQAQYRSVNMMYDLENQSNKPWTVGTNTMTVYFGEMSATMEVVIKENPVESIELLKLNATEYTLGDPEFFEKTDEGWVMNGANLEGFQLKVNYTDGTSKTLTEADVGTFANVLDTLDGQPFGVVIEEKPHTAAGKNAVGIEYMGYTGSYQVSIVEQTVVGDNTIVTEDTVEKALENKTDTTVTLDATADKTEAEATTTITSAKLPVASVEKLAADETVEQVVVELDSATVTLDTKTLEAIAQQAEGTSVTLVVKQTEPEKATEVLNEKQQSAVENRAVKQVITAEWICNETKQPIWTEESNNTEADTGKVTVKIPFTPEDGYKGTDYQVIYVADDGTTKDIVTAYKDGCLVITLEHFSNYAVINTAEEDESDGSGDDSGTTVPGGGNEGSGDDSGTTTPGGGNEDSGDDSGTTVPGGGEDSGNDSGTTTPGGEDTGDDTETDKDSDKETNKDTDKNSDKNTDSGSKSPVPDTGDNANLLGMATMMLASGMLLAAALWLTLRKKARA